MASSLGRRRRGSQSDSVDDVSETECVKPYYYSTIEEIIVCSDDIVASAGKLKKDILHSTRMRESASVQHQIRLHLYTIEEINDSVKNVKPVKRDWSIIVRKIYLRKSLTIMRKGQLSFTTFSVFCNK